MKPDKKVDMTVDNNVFTFHLSINENEGFLAIVKVTIGPYDITSVFDATKAQDAYNKFYHDYINHAV